MQSVSSYLRVKLSHDLENAKSHGSLYCWKRLMLMWCRSPMLSLSSAVNSDIKNSFLPFHYVKLELFSNQSRVPIDMRDSRWASVNVCYCFLLIKTLEKPPVCSANCMCQLCLGVSISSRNHSFLPLNLIFKVFCLISWLKPCRWQTRHPRSTT